MFQRLVGRTITRVVTPSFAKLPITKLQQQPTRLFTTTRSLSLRHFQLFSQKQQYKPTTTTTTINNTSLSTSFTTPITQQQTALFHIKLKINRHKRDRIGYKSRPHHASMKRFWQTGSGRLMRFKSGMNHKRRRKSKNQLRRLSKRAEVPKESYRRLTKMMMLRPYHQFPPGMSRPVSKFWQPPKDASKIQAKRWC